MIYPLSPRPAVRFIPTPTTGQVPVPVNPNASSTEQQGFFASLRAITPALIITGIAIGVASGLGTTVGSTIGTLLTERFGPQRKGKNSRR